MFPYIGGKFRLGKWIISHFPKNYTEMTYVEPFGGAGWVLFKKKPSKVEVYNDINSELVNLFRQIRDNYKEFRKKAVWTLHSREEYYLAKEEFPKTKEPLERALKFAIAQVQAFGGTFQKGWAYRKTKRNPDWFSFLLKLSKIRKRLEKVYVENLDFEEVIKKYDSKNTLFYLDPPYVGAEGYYAQEFTEKDHVRLAKVLKQVKGKWLLSYYPHPLIEELYKGFVIHKRYNRVSAKGITRASKDRTRPQRLELLIMNFDPEKCLCKEV